MKQFLYIFTFTAIALLATGCEEGTSRPPPALVNVINAAPGFGSIEFLRERRSEATLTYNAGSTLSFDSGPYTFNFLAESLDGSASQVVGSLIDTVAPNDHTFYVLVRSGLTVEALKFTRPRFSSTSGNFQFSIVGAAESMPNADIYFEAPTTDITTATPVGSLAFRQEIPPVTRAPGEYVVTVTAAGDTSNVLYTSMPLTFNAGLSALFAITAGDSMGLNPFNLVVSASSSAFFPDSGAQSATRIINGSADRTARDVYLDDDFTTTFAANVPFGLASAFITIAPGGHKFITTPAANPSVIEAETTLSITGGLPYTMLIAGAAGSVSNLVVSDNLTRRIGGARIRFGNTVSYYQSVEIFLQPPGTDIDTVLPLTRLDAPGMSSRVGLPPGPYEITVRNAADGNTILGPESIAVVDEGIYTIVMMDSGDGSTVTSLSIDDM